MRGRDNCLKYSKKYISIWNEDVKLQVNLKILLEKWVIVKWFIYQIWLIQIIIENK